MADYTNSSEVIVLAHQEVTFPATVVGSTQTANGKLSVYLWIYHGFTEGAQVNSDGGRIHVQTTPDDATTNEGWIDVAVFQVFTGTPVLEQLDETEAAGIKVLAVTSTTGFAAGDLIYIQDASVEADGEWATVQEVVPDVSIDIIDGLTVGKDASDIIYSNAELFTLDLDLRGVERYRVFYQHEGVTGADTVIWVRGIEVTAFA